MPKCPALCKGVVAGFLPRWCEAHRRVDSALTFWHDPPTCWRSENGRHVGYPPPLSGPAGGAAPTDIPSTMTDTSTARPRLARRIARAFAIALAAGVALVGATIAALPLMVDSGVVRRVVQREVSSLAGGTVRYHSLGLALVPLPHATIRGMSVGIPGTLEGSVAAVDIRFEVLPLLRGRVRPVAIRVEEPVFEVTVTPGAGGDPFEAYRSAVGPVVDRLVKQYPGLTLEVTGGRVDVVRSARKVVSIANLVAHADVSADSVEARASGTADRWRKATARVRIAPGSLAATLELDLQGLDTAALLGPVPADSGLAVGTDPIEATLDAETDGRSTVRAALSAAGPRVSIARGARTLDLGPVKVTANATRDPQALTVRFDGLEVGDLIPSATGSLSARPDGTASVLALQAPALDVTRLRAAGLALVGDGDAARAGLDVITAGTARDVSVTVSGRDVAALGRSESIRGEARLEAGTVAIPVVDVRVTNAAGRFVFADGTLRVTECSGTAGNSTLGDGSLTLSLRPTVSFAGFEATVDTDLAEGLPIVRRLVGRSGDATLSGVESLHGRMSGRIVYEIRRDHPHLSIDVASVAATGRYRGLPFPLAVTRGTFRLSGDRLTLRGLDGRVGRSIVRDGAAEVELGPRLEIRAGTADAVVVLDELYPWLATLDAVRPALGGVKSVTGTATVRLARVSGRIDAPASLDFEATVRPHQVNIAATDLPGPVTLTAGKATVTRAELRLDRVEASMLDARVTASGTVEEYTSPEPRVDLSLAGGLAGQQTVDWVRAWTRVPPQAMPRGPVGLAAGRAQWSGGAHGRALARGTATFAGGARAEFDVAWRPDLLDVRRVAFKDADSDATASLKWSSGAAELSFKGIFDKRSLGPLLGLPPEGRGSIRGDFRAAVDLGEPRRSSATGTLDAEGVDTLERWDIPVVVERLKLEAVGDRVRVDNSALLVARARMELSGTVTVRPTAFEIDAVVSTDSLDIDRLRAHFKRSAEAAERRPTATWDLPVEGRVVFAATTIVNGGYVVGPVAAAVALEPNRITVDSTQARLCGLDMPFKAVVTPGNVIVSGTVTARRQPAEPIAPCLTGQDLALDGVLDFDGEFASSGPPDTLLQTVEGSFRATARDGRIHRAPIIARILLLDYMTGLIRARPSELMASGLPYNEIIVQGTLADGRVRLERGTLNSWSIGIALTGDIDLETQRLALRGIATPLGFLHSMLARVPWLGRMFGRRVLGIPVSVSGTLGDPSVLPLGPTAIGQGLLNLMGAVVNAPIRLLDPTIRRPAP